MCSPSAYAGCYTDTSDQATRGHVPHLILEKLRLSFGPLAPGLAPRANHQNYFPSSKTKRLSKCNGNFGGRWGWRWKAASYIHWHRETKALPVGRIPNAMLNVIPAFLLILTGELIWKASPQQVRQLISRWQESRATLPAGLCYFLLEGPPRQTPSRGN